MTGVKLTFHCAPLIPRNTASPDRCDEKRTGNGVSASARIRAIMASTTWL